MRNETRRLFNAYLGQIAQLNNVETTALATKFSVEPSIEQKLEDKVQESSDFLSRINIFGVRDLQGEKIGLGIGSTVASRTDTSGDATRKTSDPTNLDNLFYQLHQTNFDTHLRYQKLDGWAKFPDFQTRIQNAIIRRIALDRIMTGWNGTHAAKDTDRGANPLLQDVNRGWLQSLREERPSHIMGSTLGDPENGVPTVAAEPIAVGTGGDYATLDALVYDLANGLLPTWAAGDTELVAIVGRQLLHDKYFPLINKERDPSEQLARDVIMSSKRLGGLPALQVPYFPVNAVAVTRLDNLSIYFQEGRKRRHIKDVPERDRIEDYQSSNEGYVIEDFDFIAAAENIELVSADPVGGEDA